MSKKAIIALLVIIIILLGFWVFELGKLKINDAASQSALVIGTSSTKVYSITPHWKCWLYGGTWREYPGHHMDCDWTTVQAPKNATK